MLRMPNIVLYRLLTNYVINLFVFNKIENFFSLCPSYKHIRRDRYAPITNNWSEQIFLKVKKCGSEEL